MTIIQRAIAVVAVAIAAAAVTRDASAYFPTDDGVGGNPQISGDTIAQSASIYWTTPGTTFVRIYRVGATPSSMTIEADLPYYDPIALDGDTLVADKAGVAAVVVRSGATWTEQATLLPAAATSSRIVALEGDIALVDAVDASGKHALHEFDRSGVTWSEGATPPALSTTIVPPAMHGGSLIGLDATAPSWTIRFFARVGTAWVDQGSAFFDASSSYDAVTAFAIDGDHAAVCMPAAPTGTRKVRFFHRVGSTWTGPATLSLTSSLSVTDCHLALRGDVATILFDGSYDVYQLTPLRFSGSSWCGVTKSDSENACDLSTSDCCLPSTPSSCVLWRPMGISLDGSTFAHLDGQVDTRAADATHSTSYTVLMGGFEEGTVLTIADPSIGCASFPSSGDAGDASAVDAATDTGAIDSATDASIDSGLAESGSASDTGATASDIAPSDSGPADIATGDTTVASDTTTTDDTAPTDTAETDTGATDSGAHDAATSDAGTSDAGSSEDASFADTSGDDASSGDGSSGDSGGCAYGHDRSANAISALVIAFALSSRRRRRRLANTR